MDLKVVIDSGWRVHALSEEHKIKVQENWQHPDGGKGAIVTAGASGLLASVGAHQVDVRRQPAVSIVSTGDELVFMDPDFEELYIPATKLDNTERWQRTYFGNVSSYLQFRLVDGLNIRTVLGGDLNDTRD